MFAPEINVMVGTVDEPVIPFTAKPSNVNVALKVALPLMVNCEAAPVIVVDELLKLTSAGPLAAVPAVSVKLAVIVTAPVYVWLPVVEIETTPPVTMELPLAVTVRVESGATVPHFPSRVTAGAEIDRDCPPAVVPSTVIVGFTMFTKDPDEVSVVLPVRITVAEVYC